MTRNERLMKVLAAAVAAILSVCIGQSAFAGSIVGWGKDNDGRATPPAGTDFVAIVAGGGHSLALKQDGFIVGWGYNKFGQATPPDGNDFVAIAAGWHHSLALKSDGTIVGWGAGKPGQIGWAHHGQATPPDGNDFVAIAASYDHSLALKQDGSIVGWGLDGFGQASPPAGNDFVAIAGGGYHSLALKSDGSVVGWGLNINGQTVPPAGNDYVAIAAGAFYSLALKSDSSIVGWGDDDYGQVVPPAGNDFVAISAGWFHGLALKSDGSIVSWGSNGDGQATPPAGNDFVAIAAGGYHSLAISSPSFPISDPVTGTATQAGSGLGETDPNKMVELTNEDVEIKFVPIISGGGSVTITELSCNPIEGDGAGIIPTISGIRAITALDNGEFVSTVKVSYGDEALAALPLGSTERDLRIFQLQGIAHLRWIAELMLDMLPEPHYGPPTTNIGDWGVDEVGNYVWANVDHFTDYGVGIKLVTGDYDSNKKVDFNDFSHFASKWQDVNCPDFEWCEGTDFDFSNIVDFNDLLIFTDNWLYDANDPNTW